jgi:hypothetical protein
MEEEDILWEALDLGGALREIVAAATAIHDAADKMRGALCRLSDYIRRLRLPGRFVDTVPFWKLELPDATGAYYLVADEGGLRFMIDYGDEKKTYHICEAALDTVIELFQSGRLSEFLNDVAERLREKEALCRRLLAVADAIEAAAKTA